MMGRGAFEFTAVPAPVDCDVLSGLTPSAALRFIQDAATAGVSATGMTHDVMLEQYGLIFVTAAHAVRFFRPIRAGETVSVRTDPAGCRGAHFFRQTLFTSPDGELLLEAQTDWSLIDAATGRPQRATAFPGVLDPLENWTPFIDPSRLRLPAADTPCGEHPVVHADTDENHHMNNTVYARLMTDCYRGELTQPVREFFIRYQRQAREGEIITLSRGRGENGLLTAAGAVDGSACFAAAFSCGNP